MRNTVLSAAAALLAAALIVSCSVSGDSGGTSDLYILEELETARSIEDPGKRIERLEIFVENNRDHPYRAFALKEIMEAMAVDKGDLDGALEYFDGVMEKEKDPSIRGMLLFSRFEFFWETDSLRSVELAKEVVGSEEKDFRLLMYMAYYLMGAQGQEETAEAVFKRLIDVTGDGLRKDHARTVYAEFLEEEGRVEEAAAVLEQASAYTFANAPLGRTLWDAGRHEEALERYVFLAAGAPGYRDYIKLDSLYAIDHPEPNDLESRIAAQRVSEGPQLPDMEFVNIKGTRHSISAYRGKKVVITAFSPT